MLTKTVALSFASALFGFAQEASGDAAFPPLALHPDNPHYFLFRGKPTVLITSGEHYGAVLNLDFDYVKYFDTLHADGLNLTRMFVGAYVEPEGAFRITRNTLAPARGRFICPWARSDVPGYPNGGNKFDLSRWDDAYFARLTDFVQHAAQRGVVVEVNLFCPFYEDAQWQLSPMNPKNHINGITDVTSSGVYTLDNHGGLLPTQEAMVRKIVSELEHFDNVFYEVMNEPYARKIPMDWQRHIVDVIAEADSRRHLISLNIANRKAEVTDPHPDVSILNFHYAAPPEAVGLNYALNRVIGDNETGFRGTDDAPYRTEAWEFLLAGGGLYNHLDYSFTVGHEDGTFVYPATQPGGGTPTLRRQLRILKGFMDALDFVKMKPDTSFIKGGLAENTQAWALVEPGSQYALYLHGQTQGDLVVELPSASYEIVWVSPLTGESHQQQLAHGGGQVKLTPPKLEAEIAVRIVRQ